MASQVAQCSPAKEADAGDVGSIPGLGRSPGEGNGDPPQYSCPGNPMERAAWRVTVHGVAKESDTTQRQNSICQGWYRKNVCFT